MKTAILMLIFITLSVTALAEVDSILVAGPPLSGEIHTCNENYEPEVFFLGMGAGDTGIPLIPPYIANATERAYLTFPLDSLDLTNEIDSVKIRLWAYEMQGNDNYDIWPIWSIPDGDTIKLCIDHINFGDELDVGDWTAGDFDDTQTIASKVAFIYQENYNPETWFIHVNVTDAVISDIANNRNNTQLRIRFEINSDLDGFYDYIIFRTLSPYPIYNPTLLFFYQDSTSIEKQELISINTMTLENYPNPFNPETEIRFALKESGNAELTVYNLKGQKVITLLNDHVNDNEYVSVKWRGIDEQNREVGSGIYLYKLKTGTKEYIKTMLLLK